MRAQGIEVDIKRLGPCVMGVESVQDNLTQAVEPGRRSVCSKVKAHSSEGDALDSVFWPLQS